ncbi:MAG: NYN domain-containing protein [Candidatus Omnitrophota bacterium]
MSLVYIVDGYNAMKRSGRFDHRTLKEDRAAFLSYLDHRRPQGSARNRLVVVFDGRPDVFGFATTQYSEVVFTKGESADEKIKELVSQSVGVRQIVVVTDDRALGYSVRNLGARIMGTGDFLLGPPKRSAVRHKGDQGDAGQELNLVQRESITRELSRIWLKKRSS